jgi:hypothetical protein
LGLSKASGENRYSESEMNPCPTANCASRPLAITCCIVVAKNIDELHARKGDAEIFLDEHGQRVPGNWPDSPKPTVHDILTGSTADGKLMAGKTCSDWTSEAKDQQAQVGHSDRLGPGGNPDGRYAIWNSSHENGSCADTAPRGGGGRIYCFAAK